MSKIPDFTGWTQNVSSFPTKAVPSKPAYASNGLQAVSTFSSLSSYINVKRISDHAHFLANVANFDNSNDTMLRHVYAHQQAFNTDNSKILFNGGWRWHVVVNSDGTVDRTVQQGYSPLWSNTNANRLYALDQNDQSKLITVDITNDAVATVIDLPYTVTIGKGEGGISNDDSKIVLCSSDGGSLRLDHVNTVNGTTQTFTLPRSYSECDWAMPSPSGNYVVVGYNSGVRDIDVYAWGSDTKLRRLCNQQHGDVGIDSNGDECWFSVGNLEGESNGTSVRKYRLSDGVGTTLFGGAGEFGNSNSLESLNGHLCASATKWGGDAVHISSFGPAGVHAVFAVRTDGSRDVAVYGFHNTVYVDYLDQTHFNVSRDGMLGILASNWGNSSDHSEAYLVWDSGSASVNTAPVLNAIGNKSVTEENLLSFTVTATDPETDTLTYSIDGASIALGMSINASTGAFTWTPSSAQGGLTPSVIFTVTDSGTGNLTDSETITITVNETNLAPVMDAIGNKTVVEQSALNFTVTVTDSDTLTYSIDAPSIALGMFVNATTGAFAWTPSSAQAGITPSVVFTVTDGSLTDSETIVITVQTLASLDLSVTPDQTSMEAHVSKPFVVRATYTTVNELDPLGQLTAHLIANNIDTSSAIQSFAQDAIYTGSDRTTFVKNFVLQYNTVGTKTATLYINDGVGGHVESQVTIEIFDPAGTGAAYSGDGVTTTEDFVAIDLDDLTLLQGAGTPTWAVDSTIPSTVGGSYLKASGNDLTLPPSGQYIRIDVSGLPAGIPHKMYVNYYTVHSDDEGCHYVVDGNTGSAATQYSYPIKSAWSWSQHRAGVTVSNTDNTIDIYVRESELRLRKIILIPDSFATAPTGFDGYGADAAGGASPPHIYPVDGLVANVIYVTPLNDGNASPISHDIPTSWNGDNDIAGGFYATGDTVDYLVGMTGSGSAAELALIHNDLITLSDAGTYQYKILIQGLDTGGNYPTIINSPLTVVVKAGPLTLADDQVYENSSNNVFDLNAALIAAGYVTITEVVSTTGAGSFALGGSNTLTYTPAVDVVGSETVTIGVASSSPNDDTTVTLTVNTIAQTAITLYNPVSTDFVYNEAASLQLLVSGVTGTLVVSYTGTLPTGLVLDGNGLFSGSPTQYGAFPITVTATDDAGSDSKALSITVINQLANGVISEVSGIAAIKHGVTDVTKVMFGNLQIFP